MTTPVVLAIDLGTSELKAGLVGVDGSVEAMARVPYPTEHAEGRAEQDPEAWWAALVDATARLHALADPGLEVVAVCPVAHGPTCVAVDGSGAATRPAIAWLDRRSSAESAELAEATGLPIWLLGILPAALWIERNEPEAAARTVAYLAAWEWLGLRLSGTAAMTVGTDQAVPGRRVLDALGLPSERVPTAVAPGAVLGGLTARAAGDLGLPSGTPVVAGLNDAYASILGAGLLEPGDAIDTGGSSGGFAVLAAERPDIPGAWVAAAPLPGRWLAGGAMATTGAAFDWLVDEVLDGLDPDLLLDEAAAVPAGADGLVFLPYLAGERSPIWDPMARGAFVGLTLGHRRGHLARAVLEGAAHALRHVADPIRAAGFPVNGLRVSGGNTRSHLWNHIKADILGVPVAVPEVPDTAMLGAAVLGATGVGAHVDLPAAIGAMVRMAERIEPDPATRAVHEARHATYRSLYPALRDAMHELGDAPAGSSAPGSDASGR